MATSGIAVACITGQSGDAVSRYLAEHPMPFPILTDAGRRVIKAYGVYQLIGLDAFHMARPSVFLIDGSGVVSFLYVGSHQADRPAAQVLLSAAANVLPRG